MGAAFAAAATLITVTPASAAIGVGRVQLCADGTYTGDIAFRSSAGQQLVVLVNSGTCQTVSIPAASDSILIGGTTGPGGAEFVLTNVPVQRGSRFTGFAFRVAGDLANPFVVQTQ